MFKINWSFLVVGVALALTACAAPPTAREMALASNVQGPASEEIAHRAVIEYFSHELKDPESARYSFLSPVNGVMVMSPLLGGSRAVGWFICGTVNAKNSFGGYTGESTFFAYFDPTNSSVVKDGAIDDDKYSIVDGWCRKLYRI
jgi:hypothetical protein